MIEITEARLNQEWVKFVEYLAYCGLNDKINISELEMGLKRAPAGLSEETGVSYPGGLLIHINRTLYYASNIVKALSGSITIDTKSLVKACCLHQLSKIEMMVPNDNEWEVKKRGLNYKFNEKLKGTLKVGERSAYNAMMAGIPLTPEEFEAIRCLDKDSEEARNFKFLASPITTILRQANELAYMVEKDWYLKSREEQELNRKK